MKNLPHQNFRFPTTGNIIGVPQKNDESFFKHHNQDFRKSDVADLKIRMGHNFFEQNECLGYSWKISGSELLHFLKMRNP
jgi:hypothetical protein